MKNKKKVVVSLSVAFALALSCAIASSIPAKIASADTDSATKTFDFTTMTSFDDVSMFSVGIDPAANNDVYTSDTWVTYAKDMSEVFTLDNGLKVNTSVYSGNDVSENNLYVRYNEKDLQYFTAELTYVYNADSGNGWAGFMLGYTNYARKARWGDSPNGMELFAQNNGLGTYSSAKLNESGYTEGIIPADWTANGEHVLTVVAIESGITFYVDGVETISISKQTMQAVGYEMNSASIGFMFTNAEFTAKSFSVTDLTAVEEEPEQKEVYENNNDFTALTNFDGLDKFTVGIDPIMAAEDYMVHTKAMNEMFTPENGLKINTALYGGDNVTENITYFRVNEKMKYFKAEMTYNYDNVRNGWAGFFFGNTDPEHKTCWPNNPSGVEMFVQRQGLGTYSSNKLNGGSYTEGAIPAVWEQAGDHTLTIVVDENGIVFTADGTVVTTITNDQMAAAGYELVEGNVGLMFTNAQFTIKSFNFTDLTPAHTVCEDGDKNHVCDVCGEPVGTHEVAEGKHICDYCGVTMTDCADDNKDHNCDVCGTALTTCADNNNDHNCDLCGTALTTCVDEDKDHTCDICGATVGTHAAAEGTHICEYCGVKASECEDSDNNNACDVCGNRMHDCVDGNNDHNCDKCGTALTVCADNNNDHNCDLCGAAVTVCGDNNKDHNCDICGKELSVCGDDNKDHNCDICGKALSVCGDNNNDHNCDICGTALTACADDNDDHNCDLCGKAVTECTDGDNNHACDICGAVLTSCADTDDNHKCDVCGDKLSNCKDDDGNKSCDICGKFVQTYLENYDFTSATDFNAVNMFSVGIDPAANNDVYTDSSWVTYAKEMNEVFTLENGLKVNTSVYSGNDVSENNIYVRYNKKDLQYFTAELTYVYNADSGNGWAGFILGYTNYARKARWNDSPNGMELFAQNNGLGTYSSAKLNASGYSEGVIPAGWTANGEHVLTVVAIESGITLYVDGVESISISKQTMQAAGYEMNFASIGFMFTNAEFTAKSFKVSPLDAAGNEYIAVERVEVNAPTEVNQFEALTVTATVYPDNAGLQSIKYELPECAVAANGKIYFTKPGTYTLKAVSVDNENAYYEFTVTVNANDSYMAYATTQDGVGFDNYFVTSGGSKDGAPADIADYWTFNADGTMTLTEKVGTSVDSGYVLLYLKDIMNGALINSNSFEITYMVKSDNSPNGWHGVGFALTDKATVPNQAGVSAFIQEEATKATIWGSGAGGVGGPNEVGSSYTRNAWNMIKVRVYGEGSQTIEMYVNDMSTPVITATAFDLAAANVALFTTTTITIADVYFVNLDANGNPVKVIYPESIEVNELPATVEVGDQVQITATVLPANASDASLLYTTSDVLVATVGTNGMINFMGTGEVTITVMSKSNPAVYEEFTFTVTEKEVLPTSVKFDATPDKAEIGGKYTLFVTVLPEDATNYAVTFTSSNTDVATVDADGRLTYVGAGETVITVTCVADASITASFTLTVTAPSETPDNNSGSDVQDSTQASDTASDVQSSAAAGCFGSVVGISMILPALAVVAVALTKKKED